MSDFENMGHGELIAEIERLEAKIDWLRTALEQIETRDCPCSCDNIARETLENNDE